MDKMIHSKSNDFKNLFTPFRTGLLNLKWEYVDEESLNKDYVHSFSKFKKKT